MDYITNTTKNKRIKHILSIPFIYFVFFSFIILDISVEIYHRICFPLYGIKLINRKKYIKFDRHKLNYLTNIQKLNCSYCSYGNGLINYVKEIAGETEKYWCGIKQQEDEFFKNFDHRKNFLEYGEKISKK